MRVGDWGWDGGFEQPRGDSGKLDQVRQHRRVGLTYARLTDNTYVALSGTAQVSSIRGKPNSCGIRAIRPGSPEGRAIRISPWSR